MGFDHFGNPIFANVNRAANNAQHAIYDQVTRDPYESRWLDGNGRSDAPVTIAEWERLYRRFDVDNSSLPRRLQDFVTADLVHATTPRSSHDRHASLALPISGTGSIDSIRELILVIAQRRALGTALAFDPSNLANVNNAYIQLFPLEFSQASGLDLNRPFGDGEDDDNDGQLTIPMN